jgi:hypothetical protein
LTLRTTFPASGIHIDDHLALHQRFNNEHAIYPGDGENALRAALAAGGVVRVGGTYDVTQPLTLATNVHLMCAPSTVFRATAEMDCVLSASEPEHLHIANLMIDASELAVNGLLLYKVSPSYFTAVDGLYVKKAAGDGIVLSACKGGIFQAMRADYCAGNGVVARGCNAARFYGLSACDNTGSGIVIEPYVEDETTYTGGAQIFGLHSEANAGHGVIVASSPTPSMISGGWLEYNGGDGVRVEGYVSQIQALLVGVGANPETTHAVHLVSGAKGGTVRDCSFGGDSSFGRVAVEPGVAGDWTLTPNYALNENCAAVEPIYL